MNKARNVGVFMELDSNFNNHIGQLQNKFIDCKKDYSQNKIYKKTCLCICFQWAGLLGWGV